MSKQEPHQPDYQSLSKRERQIMHIIHRLGRGSVSDVLDKLENPPAYNSIRTILGILVRKGFLTHQKSGTKYVYYPTVKPDKAKRNAIDQLVKNFFNGSTPRAVSMLLGADKGKLTLDELEAIAQMIEKAKEQLTDENHASN